MRHAQGDAATLSDLLGSRCVTGERVQDILVRADGAAWPVAAIRAGGRLHVAEYRDRRFTLGAAADATGLVSLRADVLDRQVVDVDDRRVVRVGDVAFAQPAGVLEAVALEVGARPLLRRLGLRFLTRRAEPDLLRLGHVSVTPRCLIAHVTREHIASLETHHLARLIRRLPHGIKHDVLDRLPADRAAEINRHIEHYPHRLRWRRYRAPGNA